MCGVSEGYLKMSYRIVLSVSLKKKKKWKALQKRGHEPAWWCKVIHVRNESKGGLPMNYTTRRD